jgi:hypothetical protein
MMPHGAPLLPNHTHTEYPSISALYRSLRVCGLDKERFPRVQTLLRVGGGCARVCLMLEFDLCGAP